MNVDEIRIAGLEPIEIPNVEVGETFTLELVARVYAFAREEIDTSSIEGPSTVEERVVLRLIAVKEWPRPHPLPSDYAEDL